VSDAQAAATSYLTVQRGTAVVDRFGRHVGEVERVLLHAEGTFDGIIVSTRAGDRFVDAHEVRRISDRAVTLGVAAVDVEEPDPDASSRRYGMPCARWDRTDVTEADRDAAVEALKAAFVTDELTADELARRVEIAHLADTLEQLDTALAGLRFG
jgi:hypothetical protein